MQVTSEHTYPTLPSLLRLRRFTTLLVVRSAMYEFEPVGPRLRGLLGRDSGIHCTEVWCEVACLRACLGAQSAASYYIDKPFKPFKGMVTLLFPCTLRPV